VNHLLRELAPVTDAAWDEVEREAKRSLTNFLAARRIVDFSGPHGWEAAAVARGDVDALADAPEAGVEAALRRVAPYVELRARFALSRAEVDAVDRGSASPDLQPVIDAARAIARAEDRLVFHGYAPGGVDGVVAMSPHDAVTLSDDFARYPTWVAQAVATLRDAGVEGPYAAALGPRCWAGILETTEDGGYPVLERLRLILAGPAVYAPAVEGAVVLSTRGDDFELSCGQDVSIGFESADEDNVRLYLEESLVFRVHSPEAAVALTYGA